MAIEGVDSSYNPPSAAECKAAGKRFSIRYVSTPGHAKNLTLAEAKSLTAGGVDIGIVGEITAGRALAGRAQGVADMTSFIKQVNALEGPDPSVIYMAVDFDAVASQMPAVLDYIRGGASVRGRDWTGVYGSYAVVAACAVARVCKYFWQTYAWSGGKFHSIAQLYQYRNGVTMGTATVDYCRAYTDDYGQWGASPEWWLD